MPRLRLATRATPLATRQAELAAAALRECDPALEIELFPVRAFGDERAEPLAEIAGPGVFVKAVDEQVLAGNADLAVHSCKDLPTILGSELRLVALLPRGPPHDVLVGLASLDALPAGARIGTSSPRRTAQLLRRRPDVRIVPVRGSIGSRLAALGNQCDAVALAAAGLDRTGLTVAAHPLSLERFPTAPGQGAIAITTAVGGKAERIARSIDDAATRIAVETERSILHAIGAGCTVPLGCSATWRGARLSVVAELLSPDGTRAVRIQQTIFPRDHLSEAQRLGELLAHQGANLRAPP